MYNEHFSQFTVEEKCFNRYFNYFYFYRIPAFFLRCFARILGLRWKVRGLENVDNSRGAVVLLNHQSSLDLYGELLSLMSSSEANSQ